MDENSPSANGSRGKDLPQTFRMNTVIPSDTSYLQFLAAVSKEFLQRTVGELPEADDQFYFNMELVMTEAVVNSIKHAYDGRSGPVELEWQWEDDCLTIRVADYGSPFSDFDRYAARDMDELDPLSTSGRGIIIIRTLMDRLTYTSDQQTGRNVLEMTKSFCSDGT